MNELTVPERKALDLIVRTFAEEPFTAELLEKAKPGRMTGLEAELGIERLRQRGIVETRKKAWGETFHTLASGLFSDWQQVMIPGIPDRCLIPEDGVEPGNEPNSGLAKPVFYLLAEAAHRGISLTQKGTFHKKDAARLEARVALADDLLAGLDIDYMHRDKLSKPLAVVFDAALRLGLLSSGSSSVEIREERVKEWLTLSFPEMECRLQHLWWEVYTPADVWLQHAAAALRSMPEGQWFLMEKLAQALIDAGVPTGGRSEAEAVRAIQAHWIAPLLAFGWLERGDAGGIAALRKPAKALPEPAVGERDEQWFVQPDFEVIVPPGVPFKARWELEACAEFVAEDHVDRYKITKKSWEHAISFGRDSDALIGTLAGHALFPVPEPVTATLRAWGRSYGAVTIEKVTLMRCKHKSDALYFQSEPNLSECIISQIGELDFIVRESKVKALEEMLERQGFSVKANQPEYAAGQKNISALPEKTGAGIVYSRKVSGLFPIDPHPVGTGPLKRRLNQIPANWMRSMRKYHPSTIREIIETAIEIRTSVKLITDGKRVEFVPKEVRSLGSGWVVRGYIEGEETDIYTDTCEQAQLYVPELT